MKTGDGTAGSALRQLVVVLASLALLLGICACGANSHVAACASASSQVSTVAASAAAIRTHSATVPAPVAATDPIDQAMNRKRSYDEQAAAAAAASTAAWREQLLAAYVMVQHPACFSDLDVASAQRAIDESKRAAQQ